MAEIPDAVRKPVMRLLEAAFPASRRKRRLPPVSPQGLPYASLERRMLAITIDAAIIALVLAPFNDAIMRMAYSSVDMDALQAMMQASAQPGAEPLSYADIMQKSGLSHVFFTLAQIQAGIFAAYSFIFWHFYAGTPGKLLLRMRIVDAATGARITDNQILLRIIGYGISLLPLGLGFFSIQWNRKRQGWHDRIARTAVVVFPLRGFRSDSPIADPSDFPAPAASE